MRERHLTASAFLRPPCSAPPTNPPISFISSFCCFGMARYSAKVSWVRCGLRIFSRNRLHSIDSFRQAVSFRLRPTATDTGPSSLRVKYVTLTHSPPPRPQPPRYQKAEFQAVCCLPGAATHTSLLFRRDDRKPP